MQRVKETGQPRTLLRFAPARAPTSDTSLCPAALRLAEYRFLVLAHSVEIYGAIVAALFAGLGTWLGGTITKKKPGSGSFSSPRASRVFDKQVEAFNKLYASPLVNVAFTFIEPFPVGILIALISALILRRK